VIDVKALLAFLCLPLPAAEVSGAIRELTPIDMWGCNDLARKGELLTNGKRPLSLSG
jgi:hypothetical protein